MRVTTLDFSILGLLLSGDKTAYSIRMIFKRTAMGNYSSSPGSIYPATEKLLKLGLVDRENKRGGLLRITAQGRTQIKEWMTEELVLEMIAKEPQALMLKFAFMDHLVSQPEKVAFLKSFLHLAEKHKNSLETWHSAEGSKLPLHGRLSFEYGISIAKTQISWIKSTLKLIANEK